MNFELQFYFTDDIPTMDAFVRNESERELLGIFKVISATLGFGISVQNSGVSGGGSRQRWTLVGDNLDHHAAVLSLASHLISSRQKIKARADSQSARDNSEDKATRVQKRKARLDKAKNEIRENHQLQPDSFKDLVAILEEDPRLIWHRSNFYKKLSAYLRIERISTVLLEDEEVINGTDKSVLQKSFAWFIVNSNELSPTIDDEAVVQIVAPVLIVAKSKWKGIYKGTAITFDIKDEAFKKSVFRQQIEFKNGVAIKCALQLIQRIDGRGVVRTKSITVMNVFEIMNPGGAVVIAPTLSDENFSLTDAKTPVATTKLSEPAIPAVQKKSPKVDNRQLDMFS